MTFSYFAYGSNMLSKRIHINAPSATRIGIGRLDDYDLTFMTYVHSWKGAVATIVPRGDACVWGVIWNISVEHLAHLDRQEGVKHNFYFPLYVDVVLPDGTKRNCRTYMQTACKSHNSVLDVKNLPSNRRPSLKYLMVMIKGGQEANLPLDYQEYLNGIPHNGND